MSVFIQKCIGNDFFQRYSEADEMEEEDVDLREQLLFYIWSKPWENHYGRKKNKSQPPPPTATTTTNVLLKVRACLRRESRKGAWDQPVTDPLWVVKNQSGYWQEADVKHVSAAPQRAKDWWERGFVCFKEDLVWIQFVMQSHMKKQKIILVCYN